MKNLFPIAALLLIMVVAAVSIYYYQAPPDQPLPDGNETGGIEVNRFSSYLELRNFLVTNMGPPAREYSWENLLGNGLIGTTAGLPAGAQKVAGESMSAEDYSTTNIQVAGVDEADFIKNDGKYIYVVSNNKIVIVDAYPASTARVLSTIELEDDNYPSEIFINKDRLVVFADSYGGYGGCWYRGYCGGYGGEAIINVYDITDRSNPILVKDYVMDGNYFDSRMIGDYVYVILNQPVYYTEFDVKLPTVEYTDHVVPFRSSNIYYHASDVYYYDIPDYSYTYALVAAINTQDESEAISGKVFLMASAQDMYVSLDNIYVTYSNWDEEEKTSINKIGIKDGEIEYGASGEVIGRVLNQFSMDEFNGYFRIATSTGRLSRSASRATAANHIYVLDGNLKIVGRLEDLAPGEEIYSARFMGEKGYLVTFRKVDPLFVIDLSDPTKPAVLGKLKIPGYSDYLHPYDENHIIGIGKETVAAESGDFSWFQGVKIALFDVSDVANPREMSKYVIGHRGTYSEALRDHRAFLFSKSKNLLVIPIRLAEIDESRYPYGVPANAYGSYVWRGAYVFDISLENGILLKGKVGHTDEAAVRRSLYMENILYTISNQMIKMNDLTSLFELNTVELPIEEDEYNGPVPLI